MNKKQYKTPKIQVIEIDDVTICTGSTTPNDNWRVEGGHIYNPGGHDMCGKVDGYPAHNAPEYRNNLWD